MQNVIGRLGLRSPVLIGMEFRSGFRGRSGGVRRLVSERIGLMIGCGRWPRAATGRLDEGPAGFDLAPDQTIRIAPHERHASLRSSLD